MKALLIALFGSFFFIGNSFAVEFSGHTPPPDSSSSIIDKTAALYLIDEGKKLLNQGRTRDALQKFREAFVKDKYNSKAAYWIGEAHYKLDNFGYALRYGKTAEALSQASDGDVFFLLGRAYHRQNILDSAKMNYELADIQLSQALKKAYNLGLYLEEIKYALSVSNYERKYQKELLGDNINSGYDDYNALISDDGKTMYFVSRRPETKGSNINPDDQRYFEDIYISRWDSENNEWGRGVNEIDRLNSNGFDALNYISKDGMEAYLTINTSILDQKKVTKSSDICISNFTKEHRWSVPKPIKNKTINTSFFDGAPTLTEDGSIMYFVSDREGNKSKSDIYVVEKVGNSWGTAKKLPMNVNTTENETTPYITPDNKFLFYSSNGKKGMGGYDVYVTENMGDGTWGEPVNLGPDFNTVNDDIFFKYYPELNKGVISTYTLEGQKSSMDIYELKLEGWKIPK
ncbi:MAG: PD40 domain-containing protein [Brumimicrobium sp.]|nr:PD40 domain-containing protein [Brumimicrobium sp.]MCO5267863.1 hypothetical protein [Brumimicrobium sp.]